MSTATARKPETGLSIPFDSGLLDRLMEQAGMDALLATSKHNVQYLLGGHRAFFFDYMDAMGVSRYLPIMAYQKGAPENAAYIGHRLEGFQREVQPFWTPVSHTSSSGSTDAMQKAIEHLRHTGQRPKRIGVELPFIPADAAMALRDAFPEAEIVDAVYVLERLRLRKSPEELNKLRIATNSVIDSMLAVIANHGPGTTKNQLVDALRREEVSRGLIFEYCLITAGTSFNRAPSDQRWEKGDILSLDSGGNYHGYIGDVCRMAVLGEPDAELEDLLAEIESVQRAAMKVMRPGVLGREIYTAAEALVKKSKQAGHMHFLAHGMGLVSHEAPRLTTTGPVPYSAEDAERPLESGMVVSVETTLHHPSRGFIKLEDTVVVTPSGYEVYGDYGRGWNRGGSNI
jgi:Xaa-Pro aminopeptidase